MLYVYHKGCSKLAQWIPLTEQWAEEERKVGGDIPSLQPVPLISSMEIIQYVINAH
jgi:hypothetical protein